jgi:transposase-like protein
MRLRAASATIATEDLLVVGKAPSCPNCGAHCWPVVTGTTATGFVLQKFRCPGCHRDFAADRRERREPS